MDGTCLKYSACTLNSKYGHIFEYLGLMHCLSEILISVQSPAFVWSSKGP